jgi:fatty-acyl-CoA synthase
MEEEPRTLREVLVRRAAADPDRLGFAEGDRSITYAQLLERAADRAGRLRRLGVTEGDRVALVMPAGIGFAEVFWAVQLIGAIPCAINPGTPREALERRLALLRPRLVVDHETLADIQPLALPGEPPSTGPEDIAFMQLTSGTTGAPRAAMIHHSNVIAYRNRDGASGHVLRDDVLVGWVPPWHDLGLVHFVIGGVFHAVPCHIVRPAIATIPDWLATISRVRGTLTGGPDFAFRLAARMVDPASVDLTSLRFVVNGGEPVRASTIERFEGRFGLSGVMMPGYGLAEATLGVTTCTPGEPLVVDERGNVSCGTPLDVIEVRVDGDSSGPGEIVARGATVFAGYFDAPEDTAAALRDGWLHTGDAGYMDAEGRLYVLGRERAMIKRAGAVIAPRELEEAAQEADGVTVAAVVGLPASHDAVTETVAVVVEADSSRGRDDVASEVSRTILSTSGFAPGRIAVVPPRTIPRTANGKIRHGELRALLLAGAIGGTE